MTYTSSLSESWTSMAFFLLATLTFILWPWSPSSSSVSWTASDSDSTFFPSALPKIKYKSMIYKQWFFEKKKKTYWSSDSDATATKSSSLSTTVDGVRSLPRLLRRGIEDRCNWWWCDLKTPRLYSILLHPKKKKIKKKKYGTVNKKDAWHEFLTRIAASIKGRT